MNADQLAVVGEALLTLLEDILAGRARLVLRHMPVKPEDGNMQFGAFETTLHVVRDAAPQPEEMV